MNSADAILATLARLGVRACFANPGTTELPFVEALGRQSAVHGVLVLHEGVATGAADGYSRVAGGTGCALLHLGPGLANGASFLHDARRARTPLVVLVGEHALRHLPYDPPLASDIEGLARTVAVWVERLEHPGSSVHAAKRAFAQAHGKGGPAVLIVPQDVAASPYEAEEAPEHAEMPTNEPPATRSAAVAQVADALERGEQLLFILGGRGARPSSARIAWSIAAQHGAEVTFDTFCSVIQRGSGSPPIPKLPYFPDAVQAKLPKTGTIVLVGARPPLSFFAYPGLPSLLAEPQVALIELAPPGSDGEAELSELARLTGTSESNSVQYTTAVIEPVTPGLGITPVVLATALAGAQAEGNIIVDEGRTGVTPYFDLAARAPAHTYLGHVGGAIGEGLPLSVGAASAYPDRTVIAIQSDGGGMYAPQSLWTMAREQLDVKVFVVSNRGYRILGIEMERAGMTATPAAKSLLDMDAPPVDWPHLALSMGVGAERAANSSELADVIAAAMATKGPYLVEALMA